MHNINSMMYYGAKPWHKLGTEVSEAQTSRMAPVYRFKASGEYVSFPWDYDVHLESY